MTTARKRAAELERRAEQNRQHGENSDHYGTKQFHLGIAIGYSRAADLEAQRAEIEAELGAAELGPVAGVALETISPTGETRRYCIERAECSNVAYWLIEEQASCGSWRTVGRQPLTDARIISTAERGDDQEAGHAEA